MPIVPDEAGNTAIEVTYRHHRNPVVRAAAVAGEGRRQHSERREGTCWEKDDGDAARHPPLDRRAGAGAWPGRAGAVG